MCDKMMKKRSCHVHGTNPYEMNKQTIKPTYKQSNKSTKTNKNKRESKSLNKQKQTNYFIILTLLNNNLK